jgi:hypothetical protein
METEMMMELTFDAVRGARDRAAVPTRLNERAAHGPRVPPVTPPSGEILEIGRGLAPAPHWHTANRWLQHIEDGFAASVCIGLLVLGTLTFGYAFDGAAAAQAASVRSVAASK